MWKFMVFIFCSIIFSQSLYAEGVFGMHKGMSLDEVKALDFGDMIKVPKQPDFYFVKDPSNLPSDWLLVCISPQEGLLKIAMRWEIQTNRYGDKLKNKFSELLSILTDKYGTGKKKDLLKSGSIWDEQEDWMMGLKQEERVLMWMQDDFDKNSWMLETIGLSADASSMQEGTLSLSYEFQGWTDYINKKKAQQAEGF